MSTREATPIGPRPTRGDAAASRRRHWRAAAPVAVGCLVLALSACGDGTSSESVAQVRVTAKERALADAQDQATAAKAAFCSSSATYITAIDRYGDILSQSAPTVGDVTEAGADLTEPGAETVAAAEAAQSAVQQVAEAEQELADAEASLAAAQASAAGETPGEPSTAPTGSADPSTPPASLTRVQQAESEFSTAQKGLSAETPLQQASVQFNSAAVALEMAWLHLFADAGCLADAQQEEASAAVRSYTLALQQSLAEAGYFDGEVDGVYGPETVDAVQALQKANGLPQTGAMDKATTAALQAELVAMGGAAAQQETASTAAVQQTLMLAGYWDGPIDGQWTAELTDALKEFQTELGVPATGSVDAATIAALEKALASANETPTSSPPAASPTPSAPEPSATE